MSNIYKKFHSSFEDALNSNSRPSTVGDSIEDSFGHIVQKIVQNFACISASTHVDIDDFLLTSIEESCILSSWAHSFFEMTEGYLSVGNARNNNLRAERDLWKLLELMSNGNVLGKMGDDSALRSNAISNLPVTSTVPDCINAAFPLDAVLRKGEILKQWLEQCAEDEVTIPLLSSESSGLDGILDEVFNVNGQKFSQPEQESRNYDALLKSVWQLVRSGQMQHAQQLAFDHRVYWLAALLRGADPSYYSQVEPEMVTRIGNVRQPIWSLTCWKLVDSLSQSKTNFSEKSKFELLIYAAISNNFLVQVNSSVSLTWHDKTWSIVKAAHTRNIMRVLVEFRQFKAREGENYLSAQRDVIEAEKEYLASLEKVVGDVSLASCSEVFLKNPVPSATSVEALIIQLQSIFMCGYSGLESYMKHQIPLFVSGCDKYQRDVDYVRTMVHVLLWIKFAPKGFADDIRNLVQVDTFYSVLEVYIDCLVQLEKYDLVATYCVFLSRQRRVEKYSNMLLVVQQKVLERSISDQILKTLYDEGASLFQDDIKAVFRMVMKKATRNTFNFLRSDDGNRTSVSELRSCFLESVSYNDHLQILSLQWFGFSGNLEDLILESNQSITCCLDKCGFRKMNFVSTVLNTIKVDQFHRLPAGSEAVLELFEITRVKFRFWGYLDKVVEHVEVWFRKLEICQTMVTQGYKNRTIQEISDLVKLSEEVLVLLEECFQFKDRDSCDGFVDMWNRSKDAACSVVEEMLEELISTHQEAFDAVDECTVMNIDISTAICSKLLHDNILSNNRIRCIKEYLKSASQMRFTCKNILFSAEEKLDQCNALLNNIISAENFSKHCLRTLVEAYFEICFETANWLKVRENGEEKHFYQRALQFSNFIVSEDNCFRLHSLMDRNGSEKVLEQLNRSMVSLLEIDPDALNF